MLVFLQRLLGLPPRELRRALPLFGYLFLTMAGSVASKATRDALFLEQYRAVDLPYADIAIAALVGVVAAIYVRIGHRVTVRTLQVGSLLFFAACAALFWWLSRGGESGALFVVIYVWVGVFSVLVPTQVWTLANYVLTTREAKRGFGLIGSGAILGWIVGGLATRVTAGSVGVENLLLWIAGTLVLSAGLVLLVWRDRPSFVANEPAGGTEPLGFSTTLTNLRTIHHSRYLRAIALVILLSALTTTVVGWQFKAIAKAMVPDTNDLAVFFGTFNMVAGLASLALQLALTSRVLRHLGVGAALFIVPIALSASSVGLLLLGTLVAASALKASDQVLRYSIDKVTVELLYLPVPAAQTFRVKAFIDTVIYRSGDALGGLVVLIFAAAMGMSPVGMAWVVLVLIGAWLAAAGFARREYVANLSESIHQHRVDTERSTAPVLERSAADLIVQKLDGETTQIVYALGLFEMAHDRKVHPAVRGLVRHESPEVRRRAIALLSRAGDTTVQDEIEALLNDPFLEVRTEALLFLAEHARIDPLERIEELGAFPDFSIQAAMAAYLARPGRGQNVEAARTLLARMVDDCSDAGVPGRIEAARLVGVLPDAFDREFRRLLQDTHPDVARAAIDSVGRLRKRVFVPRVLERLADPALTASAVDTLASFGDRIVGTLRDCLVDADQPLDVRRQVPVVLQAIGTSAAQLVLTESVLDSDTVLRYHVITALNKLGQLHPERRVNRKIVETVLAAEIMGHYRSYQVLGTLGAALEDAADPVEQGLRESMDHEAERIFRLLKILYPDHDLHSAYVGLHSKDPVVHDNALEFLEAILTPPMRALLVPLFDRDVSLAGRARIANRLLGAPLGDREEAIEVMMLSQDPWLQSCAAYTIGELRLLKFADALDRWSHDPDPLLRATALDAREKLKRAATSSAGVGLL
ncbi:MAG: Npt1/Npt2 family nucleotide transporter [Vicinamibacterales bacterium]